MSYSNLLRPKYLFILICLLFLITRLYKINQIPASVYWDEASIGYNAYSITLDGRDEWGKFLPIHFRAFGEFKLPVYIYVTAAFVKVFGLNEFSVRIPAVLFSLGVIIMTYLLAKKVTKNTIIGLLSSFFVTISPYFFIFSRTGYEATAGLMFYLLAIYLLLIKGNNWNILFSIISFIISFYSYNSFRILTPITILVIFILNISYFKLALKKDIAPLILAFLILSLSVIPIYRLYTYDTGSLRFQTVSVLKAKDIFGNYFSHFSLDFLLNGDKNSRSQQKGFGQIYLPDFILIFLGLLFLLIKKQKNSIILLLLLLISPIPAAITKESPHALRTISLAPFLSIFSALGVISLRELLERIFSKKIGFIEFGTVIIMFLFFINYLINFIKIYPSQSSKDWQYGYKRIYTDFQDQLTRYQHIVISDEYAQPYIFALFYLKINPEAFRKTVMRNHVSNWGFSTVSDFDKFKFGKVNKLSNDGSLKNSLIFSSDQDKLPNKEYLNLIKSLDGDIAFWVYQL
ncbi:glycosyltransferase family 39 protein [Candidatus Daviesbacteria bacterium]|nr:glycosyltransferase family 39 protein [Candidatus Daviesbacteria bacterium]